MQPITIHNWPHAIMHVDCDAFFASVEQAIHPELKGRPVITGAERGIVAAASYEAKKMGVRRGVPLNEVTRICPECVLLPSDYETYSLFSERLFAIIRRFSPVVEEYSIDEAFLDLTGLRRLYRKPYAAIGAEIQETIHKELDLTVSVGISLSKSLAKLCSKFRKPSGLTAVPGRHIHHLLRETSLEKVWGFGANTAALLQKHGVKGALDYVKRPRGFVEDLLGKIGVEIWMELRGEYVYKLNTEHKETYGSISKAKTFTPPSTDASYVFAQALRNLESACIKARCYNLAARRLVLFLRRQDFKTEGEEARLSRATSSPLDLTPVLKSLFARLFQIGRSYRATNIVLADLIDAFNTQFALFEDPLHAINSEKVFTAVDEVARRFGKHTVFLSEGLNLKGQHKGARAGIVGRKKDLLHGETARQHIGIPLLRYKLH